MGTVIALLGVLFPCVTAGPQKLPRLGWEFAANGHLQMSVALSQSSPFPNLPQKSVILPLGSLGHTFVLACNHELAMKFIELLPLQTLSSVRSRTKFSSRHSARNIVHP